MTATSKKLSLRRRGTTMCLLLLGCGLVGPALAAGKKLKVGVTLHPYYSFVANIVGDKAEVVPLIAGDANPHMVLAQIFPSQLSALLVEGCREHHVPMCRVVVGV